MAAGIDCDGVPGRVPPKCDGTIARAQVELYQPSFINVMGIDIYARYSGRASREVAEQHKRWLSATAGSIGCLREAYHGEPYATKFLARQAFASGEASIPAATLRERLAETLRLAERREIEAVSRD